MPIHFNPKRQVCNKKKKMALKIIFVTGEMMKKKKIFQHRRLTSLERVRAVVERTEIS